MTLFGYENNLDEDYLNKNQVERLTYSIVLWMHKKHVKGLYSFALSHNVIEKYFDLKRTSMKIHSIPQQISDEGDFILWQNVVLARQAFELQQKTVKLSI